MELLNIDCLGRPLRLEGSLAGWQQLFWDNNLVAQKNASAENEGMYAHEFEIRVQALPAAEQISADSKQARPAQAMSEQEPAKVFMIRLESNLRWQPFSLNYRLLVNEQVVSEGERNTKDIERQVPTVQTEVPQKFNLLSIGSLAFKLLKSAKIIKVLFGLASLAAYSWLFSFQFAVALIACLMVHEYGHIRAMHYFGMKTKGIYIIPFMGGLALTEDKINTRWQDVTISIMGPIFGLCLSLLLMLAYWITGNVFFAGLANFNALINLINLLPILPLDGGHILKSVGFSINGKFGLAALILGSVIGIVGSYTLGLSFLAFFMLIGSIEIVMEWKMRHQSALLPLDRYGQIFSTIWYLLTVGALVAIMWYFSHSGDPALSAPMEILRS
ncbi:site-2 protease family protein [Undibacterium flavidum]|uniref:Site-2 protease family protein n=1 Tax=Undibacterium flavidum TaxID=2762297 RepID=A0ABR6Y7H3_9BURK|nr:site-2 protease family protein [Undibacterium flavidum]MBC3872556.1 site-2 protease family protein [Undibacterium flavidum]